MRLRGRYPHSLHVRGLPLRLSAPAPHTHSTMLESLISVYRCSARPTRSSGGFSISLIRHRRSRHFLSQSTNIHTSSKCVTNARSMRMDIARRLRASSNLARFCLLCSLRLSVFEIVNLNDLAQSYASTTPTATEACKETLHSRAPLCAPCSTTAKCSSNLIIQQSSA